MQRWRFATTVFLASGFLGGAGAISGQTTPAGDVEGATQNAGTQGNSVPTASSAPVEEATVSQARIVRLSQVNGVVQMDRNTGRGFEPAFANIPVIAGARLRTGDGVAEVEFEDNSSLRLAPNTEIQFTRLGRMASGGTQTTVDVKRGLVYVGLEKTKGNQFALMDGSARVEVLPGAHMRLAADQPQAQLAVFDGTSQLSVGSSTTVVGKKQTVSLEPGTQTVSTISKGTDEGDWDVWDKQQNDYHKQKANVANVGGFGLYGANDLGYYGSFVDMPGCGSLWRPYFASTAWDPFASGVWTYYPTGGYSWVSPYPWGWLPYHSGSWVSCGTSGWGWQPGGSWYGVNNVRAMRIAGHPLPHPVPPNPVRNGSTLVPVNMKQMAASGMEQNGGFTFRRDSAGLGVPRSAFGDLHGFAGHVERSGALTRRMPENALMIAPASAHQVPNGGVVTARTSGPGQMMGRASNMGIPPSSLHSAYAPVRNNASGSGSTSSPSPRSNSSFGVPSMATSVNSGMRSASSMSSPSSGGAAPSSSHK